MLCHQYIAKKQRETMICIYVSSQKQEFFANKYEAPVCFISFTSITLQNPCSHQIMERASSSARPKHKWRTSEKTGDATIVNDLKEYEISSNEIRVDHKSIGTGMNPTFIMI